MSRYRKSLTDVFDAYGDDAAAALAAWANLDPEAWSEYVDRAAEKQYRTDYGAHRRSMTRSVERDALAAQSGQAQLFETSHPMAKVELRRSVVLDGTEYDVAALSGHDGAAIVRKVAERDLAPSLTTVNRCKFFLQVADHVDSETERLGRPVTFGEVLGWAA